jgi:hypothetical protein
MIRNCPDCGKPTSYGLYEALGGRTPKCERHVGFHLSTDYCEACLKRKPELAEKLYKETCKMIKKGTTSLTQKKVDESYARFKASIKETKK